MTVIRRHSVSTMTSVEALLKETFTQCIPKKTEVTTMDI